MSISNGMPIQRETFEAQRHPRFGSANPERMDLHYWKWLVRSGYGPNRARTILGFEEAAHTGPEWTFSRMGDTRTDLGDGRIVCVGGEYDDWYDPDFSIYNDVIVLGPGEQVEIYGYPEEVFPPTDFHTATLVEDLLLLIGSLGYSPRRRPETTPVYCLDTTTYAMKSLATSGQMPGWIFEHEATLEADGRGIIVRGGQTIVECEGERLIRTNVDEFRLDLQEFRWYRMTDRSHWRQFLLTREDGHYWCASYDACHEEFPLPGGRSLEPMPRLDFQTRQVAIDGVVVQISHDMGEMRLLFRGELPESVVSQFVNELVSTIESATNHKCRVRAI